MSRSKLIGGPNVGEVRIWGGKHLAAAKVLGKLKFCEGQFWGDQSFGLGGKKFGKVVIVGRSIFLEGLNVREVQISGRSKFLGGKNF